MASRCPPLLPQPTRGPLGHIHVRPERQSQVPGDPSVSVALATHCALADRIDPLPITVRETDPTRLLTDLAPVLALAATLAHFARLRFAGRLCSSKIGSVISAGLGTGVMSTGPGHCIARSPGFGGSSSSRRPAKYGWPQSRSTVIFRSGSPSALSKCSTVTRLTVRSPAHGFMASASTVRTSLSYSAPDACCALLDSGCAPYSADHRPSGDSTSDNPRQPSLPLSSA